MRRVPSPDLGPSFEKKEAVRRLSESLQFPTVSQLDPAKFASEAFRDFREFLKREFPRVHSRLTRELVNDFALLYTWPGSDSELNPLLLMAHQDVVPVDPGTEDDWAYPPFSGKVADGHIWGRGALDVKSGLMGILEAVEALLAEEFRPRRTVLLAFGHDEEIGGKGGAAKVAAVLRDRNIRLEYVLDEGGNVVEGIVPGVAGPVALVGVAEKGYLNLEISAHGEGGHSSMPLPESAVGILSRAISRIESKPFPANMAYLDRMFRHLGDRMTFLPRIAMTHLGLVGPLVGTVLRRFPKMNAEIRTTAATTLIHGGVKENVIPGKVSALVNCRIMPGETSASVVDRINRVVGDSRIRIKAMENAIEPSPVSDVGSKPYEILKKTILQVAPGEDLAVAPYLVVGATDSRYFNPLSKNVFRFLFNRMKKEDLPRLHGVNERIAVENYLQVVRFYALLLKNSQDL